MNTTLSRKIPEVTTSIVDVPFDATKSVVAGVFYFLMQLLGILGTGMVLTATLSTGSMLRLPPYMLVTSLGVADFIAYTGFMYPALSALAMKPLGSMEVNYWFGFLCDFSWFTIHWHLLFTAINRFTCIVIPQYKTRVFSQKNTCIMIAAAWIIGFASSVLHVLPNGSRLIYYAESCYSAYDEKLGPSSTFFGDWNAYTNYTMLVVLAFLYVPCFWKLWKIRRSITTATGNPTMSQQEIKFTLQFVVQYVIYAGAGIMFPIITHMTGDTFSIGCFSLAVWMMVSFTDPFVYLIINKLLRRRVVEKFCFLGNIQQWGDEYTCTAKPGGTTGRASVANAQGMVQAVAHKVAVGMAKRPDVNSAEEQGGDSPDNDKKT